MRKLLLIVGLAITALIACDDFFEEDISDKSVILIAPVDGLVTGNSSFTFWWEELDGASKYNLQIVKPSFSSPDQLILDTNIIATQFAYQLFPGSFEWRVRAMNGSSKTPYTTYTVSVDSSMDLSHAILVLNTPIDNFATNNTTISFNWADISYAEEYQIRVRKDNWTGEIVYNPNPITENTIQTTISTEGTYVWGVQALNSSSSSPFKTRTLFVDLTAPQKPTLTLPGNGAETTTTVSFEWSRVTDIGSAITDSLVVSTDSTFSSSYDVAYATTGTSYSTTFDVAAGSSKKYFWRVRSIDAAGNKSEYSLVRKFTVKNEK